MLEERWVTGEWFRSGMVWALGRGRVFYFRPGHETYPVFKEKPVLQLLENAVRGSRRRPSSRRRIGAFTTSRRAATVPIESRWITTEKDEPASNRQSFDRTSARGNIVLESCSAEMEEIEGMFWI